MPPSPITTITFLPYQASKLAKGGEVGVCVSLCVCVCVCVSVCVCVVFFPVQKQRPLLRRVGRTSLIGQPHCGGLAVPEPGAGFSAS